MRFPLQLTFAVALSGCGALLGLDDPKDAPIDSGADAMIAEAGADSTMDAPPDTASPDGSDAARDAGIADSSSDSATDSASDAPTDARPDVDAGPIACPATATTLVALDGGNPWSVAADSTNVYWTQPTAGIVAQRAISGGAVITFNAGSPLDITVDATHLYWTEQIAGNIQRAPIGGGAASLVTTSARAAGITYSASLLYFTAADYGTVNVVAANADGGAATNLVMNEQYPVGTATDGTSLYWAAQNAGYVRKSGLDGGAGVSIGPSQNGPVDVATDGAFLYWTDQGSAQIMKMAIGTTTPTPLSIGTPMQLRGIWVDASCVYWADYQAGTISWMQK